MPFRSEKQRRYLWKNNPEIARKWTNEHGSTPVKAKKGKYQELEHPDHEIKPIEHKEENVSSKERVEKLLDERKTKKETKKKLVKQGQNYVPGWRPNLSVKAKESKYITKKDHNNIEVRKKLNKWSKSLKNTKEIYKLAHENKAEDRLTVRDLENARKIIHTRKHGIEDPGATLAAKGKMIKAKKGLWTGAKTNIFEAPSGWDAKKISKKTGEKLFKVFKHRERGGYKQATDYKKYLKGLKKMTTKTLPAVKSKSYYFQDIPKGSKFLQRRMTLGGPKAALAVLKAVGRRTHIGKAVAAATVVAGAYEAGKRKLFTKDKKKKKVTKKSIGGETVIMKSGGGYIDDLL